MVIATTVSGAAAWDELVLECAELEDLGPALTDITTHMEMRGRSGTFEARVMISYKYADGSWSSPAAGDELLNTVNADGYPTPNVFSDRTRLGRRRIRVVLQYRANAGGAIGDRATLSVGIACRPFCC